MSSKRSVVTVDVPVILGAGVLGTLTAKKLQEAGIQPILVEPIGLGGGQTTQCHGYIHRGYIYGKISAEERAALNRGADQWNSIFEDLDFEPEGHPVIGFADPLRHVSHTDLWPESSSELRSQYWADGFPNLKCLYETPETVMSVEGCFERLSKSLNLRYLRGRALKVTQTSGGQAVVGISLEDGRVLDVMTSQCVVTAGYGTASIDIKALLGPFGALTRESWMLVARSNIELPPGLVLPGDETAGLFIARTRDGSAYRYLISTHTMRLSGSDSTRWSSWLGEASRAIEEYLPQLWNDKSARWGMYRTRRAEISSTEYGKDVPSGGILGERDNPVQIAFPGKLTLAPLVADELANRLLMRSDHLQERSIDAYSRSRALEPWLSSEPVAAAPAVWKSVPMMLRDELMVTAADAKRFEAIENRRR